MSVSARTGELYYTDDEKEAALRNNNALQFAASRGYHLVKTGSEYHLKEHDSMVFKPDGRWFWNSQGLSGHAIDFIQHYEGKSYTEAILMLAGTLDAPAPVSPMITPIHIEDEKKEFVLPERAEDYKIIFAYLIKERGIDADLVKQLVTEKKIYQSKAYNNLVMVGYDENNVARYASLRSTNSYTKAFKVDVTGSDKSYPFVINGKEGSNTVCVFESPIEAMSYWSLCKETGSDRLNYTMLSLGGAGTQLSLERYLNDHPGIKNIVIGLNNDSETYGHTINAGRNGTERIMEKYGDQYNVSVHTPHLNDWNDVLKSYRKVLQDKLQKIKQREDLSHEVKKVHAKSKREER